MASSGDSWETPQWLFDHYNRAFGFSIDAAASYENAKVERFYSKADSALDRQWDPEEVYWCNPPYSRGMQAAFVERALDCAKREGLVVMLLPADTSTRLFHEIKKEPLCQIQFLKGRIRFTGAPGPAKFGSMIVTFGL